MKIVVSCDGNSDGEESIMMKRVSKAGSKSLSHIQAPLDVQRNPRNIMVNNRVFHILLGAIKIVWHILHAFELNKFAIKTV